MTTKTEKRKLSYEELWEKREEAAIKVDQAFDDARSLRAEFLRKRGWDYSCEYPDSCWRWSKVIKGQNICLNEAQAFDMERNFVEPMDTGD